MRERHFPAANPRSLRWHLTTKFARAPLTAAMIAAAPAAAADLADLAQLKAHIGSVQTMTANFVQTDSRGRSAAGTLQLKRPGKVRFQYGSGDLLLVADGTTLLPRLSGRPEEQLAAQPRRRLARCSPARPTSTARLSSFPAAIRASLSPAPRTPSYGQLTLAFLRSGSAPGGLQMYGWTAIDPQGHRTTVKLSNVRYNVRCRTAPSPTPSRRSDRMKKVSYCDLFIALSGAIRLNRTSVLHLARGFPLLPGCAGSLA